MTFADDSILVLLDTTASGGLAKSSAELLGAATELWKQGRLQEALEAAHKAPDVPLRKSMITRFTRDLARAKGK